MPQTSIAYAVGRVRAAARKPLGETQLERLLSAATYDDALRLLGEMGWPESRGGDVEQVSVRMLEQACEKLRAISPESELTDSFLLRHDGQNLKALLKARILGVKPEGLSNCGTIPLDVLRHAVTEHNYKKLPPALEEAMNALEKKVALEVDPTRIDVLIDQAVYGLAAERVKGSKSQAAKAFFEGRADLKNAVSFLRMQAMQEKESRFMGFLLPGGAISPKAWQDILKKPETLGKAFAHYGKAIKGAVEKAQADTRQIPALEKAADDYLLKLFRPSRNEPFSIEVLLGWLLAHEREAGAVRLIMAGKLNGFSREQITERLREAYGR